MELQLLLVMVICGLNIYLINGFPTKLTKSVPNFKIGGTLKPLADPDKSLEIPKMSSRQAEVILEDLGYATPDGLEIATRSEFGVSERIRIFQRDYGLPETGILDDETRLAIGSPRCGVRSSADKTTPGVVRKWSKSALSYTIANFPDGQPKDTIRALIKRSFREWSRVTNLDFEEVRDSDSADIEIVFGGKDHNLRDGECSFESSKTMAHAFFPKMGDLHFNTKYFFEEDKSLRDFLDTALHEIGHSLGLDHINSEASLMHPSASNQFTKPQPIDVKYIQALYGVRNGSTYNSPSAFCSLPKIDAIFEDVYGKMYAFAGDYYYDLAEGNPDRQLISSKWPGLPGNIDAAFQFGNGRSYFFKGDKYYRFKGNRMERIGLKTIRKGFPGLPSDVDAVFVDGEGDLFVFKGTQYWIYLTELKRAIGPKDIESLGIVPEDVDAVVLRSDKTVMSFKGKNYYTWSSEELSEGETFCRSSG